MSQAPENFKETQEHYLQQMRQKEAQEVEKATEKLVLGKGSEGKRLFHQFVFVAKDNSKFNILNPQDISSFEKSMSKIQITNIFTFSTVALLCGLTYQKLGYWTPCVKRPWLRILRHTSVLLFPSLIISPMISTQVQKSEIDNINMLATKYKDQIFDPDFNKQLVEEMMQKKKNRYQPLPQQKQQQNQQQEQQQQQKQ